jgi:eukaryotic-like serine/threonine-protein kinase
MKPKRIFLPSPDRRMGDRYELIECLGDGSYGWVWRAQRLEDQRIVAVKIPKEQGAKNGELAEGSALVGHLPHPNVISVHWMGRVPPEREWYAIEMEYFPGLTLSQLLDRGEQGFIASYERILSLYEKVLSGVEYLHQLGVSHGDLKPQNILVSGEEVKLTDFGCSIFSDDLYARTRENGGTILYSAPEFVGSTWRGRDSQEFFLADVYSLGVLMYQLVTARLPHDTLSQVARYIPFPKPRELNTSISPALEEFIMKALSLEPTKRWSSVTEMLAALKRVRALQDMHQPVRSVPVARKQEEDWSSQVLYLLNEHNYYQAENIAATEFKASNAPQAFLLMLTAAYRDTRYFDCLKYLEEHEDLLIGNSPIARDLRRLVLQVYFDVRQIHKAEKLLALCLEFEGESPELLIKRAALLGTQAKYAEAVEILLRLNKEFPHRPAVLRRLVLAYEQSRDTGKAAAFLRAYMRLQPDDPWAKKKQEHFSNLGVR